MAVRPVFIASDIPQHFVRKNVEFKYFSGFSDQQKRRSTHSLHQAFLRTEKNAKLLEISSSSENELGVKLSAFNLMLKMKSGRTFSVESAYQGSKVFEKGGPYTDLLDAPSIKAKRDDRLRDSGRIIGFSFAGRKYPIVPVSFFYNWLYLNGLKQNKELSEQLTEYDAFTDIAFNPQKSSNCQAEAAALYVSLYRKGLIREAMKSPQSFLKIAYPMFRKSV